MKHLIEGKEVNIDWDRSDLIDKHDSGCADYIVIGLSDDGIEYSGQGNYQDDELMEIYKIEVVEPFEIDFNEIVEYGRKNGGNIVNGMPWSFHFNGLAVSHENDELYLITTIKETVRMGVNDILLYGNGYGFR